MELFVRGRDFGCGNRDSFVVVKGVKVGCSGFSRKMVREIRKKYNYTNSFAMYSSRLSLYFFLISLNIFLL